MSSLTYTQVCENLNNTVTLQVLVHNNKVFIDDVKIDALINNEKFRIITKQGVRMQFNFDAVLEVRPLSMDSELPTPREIDNEYEIVDTDDKREAHLQRINDFENAMSNNQDLAITIKNKTNDTYYFNDERIMPLVISHDKSLTYIQYLRYSDLTYCITIVDIIDSYRTLERLPLYASEEEVKVFTEQLEGHIKNRDRINIVLVNGTTQADYIPLVLKDASTVTLFNYDTNEVLTTPINHIKKITKVCFAQSLIEPDVNKAQELEVEYLKCTQRLIARLRNDNRAIIFKYMLSWYAVDLAADNHIVLSSTEFWYIVNKDEKTYRFPYSMLQYCQELKKPDNVISMNDVRKSTNEDVTVLSSPTNTYTSMLKENIKKSIDEDRLVLFKYRNEYFVINMSRYCSNKAFVNEDRFQIYATKDRALPENVDKHDAIDIFILRFYFDEIYSFVYVDKSKNTDGFEVNSEHKKFLYDLPNKYPVVEFKNQFLAYNSLEYLYNTLEKLSKTENSIIFYFEDVEKGRGYTEIELTRVFIGDADKNSVEDIYSVDVNGLNVESGVYTRFPLYTVANIESSGKNRSECSFVELSKNVYEENISKLENNIRCNVSSVITDVKKREQLFLRLVNIDRENNLVSGINCNTQKPEARSLNMIAYVSSDSYKQDHPVVEKPVQLKAGAKLGSQEPIEIPSIFTPKEQQSPYQRLNRHTRLGHFQSWMKAKTLINFIIQTPTELINKRGYVINININDITFRTLECIEITAKIDDIKNVINVTSTSKVEELEQSLIVFSINNIPVELTRRNTSNLKEQGFVKSVTGSLKNEKKIEFFNMMNSQTYDVELENILEAKEIEGSRGAELKRLYVEFLNTQKKKDEETQKFKLLVSSAIKSALQSDEEKLRLLNKSLNKKVTVRIVLKNNKILDGHLTDVGNNKINNRLYFYAYNELIHSQAFTIDQVSSVEEIGRISEDKIKQKYDKDTQMNMLNDSKDKKYMIKVSFNNDTNIVGYALDTSDEMNIQFGDYSTSKFHKFCLSDVTNIIIINSFFANTLISNYNKIKSAAQNVLNDEEVKCKLTCDVLRKIEYTTDINMVEELKNAYLISFNYNKKRRLVKITEIGTTFLIGYEYNTLMAAIEDKDYQIKSFTYSQMTYISVNQETDKPLDNCIKKITLINKFNEVKKTQKRKFKGLAVRLTINNNEIIDCLISNINNQYVLYTNDNKCHNKYFSNNFVITKWELIDEVQEQNLKDRIKLLKENCRIAINGCKIVKITSVFNRIYTGNVISNTDDKYITLKDGNRYISIYFKDISDFTFVENNNTELFKTLRKTVNNYKLVSVKHKVTGEETVGIIVAINTQNNTFVLKNENNSYSFNIDYVTVDTNYEDKKITKIVRDNIQKVDKIQIFKDMIKNLPSKNTVINVKYGGKEYNDMYVDCYNKDTVVVYNKEGKYSSFKFSKIEALTIAPVKVEPINFDNIKAGDTCSFIYNDKQRIVTINYTDDKHINGVSDNDGSIKTFSKDKITKFVKI